ncbi:MAG: hypothetical protein ACOX4B_08600 [Bacillota bacterium]
MLDPVYQASVQIIAPQTPVPSEVIKSPHFMGLIIDRLDLRDRIRCVLAFQGRVAGDIEVVGYAHHHTG